jgi:hypothetical protein
MPMPTSMMVVMMSSTSTSSTTSSTASICGEHINGPTRLNTCSLSLLAVRFATSLLGAVFELFNAATGIAGIVGLVGPFAAASADCSAVCHCEGCEVGGLGLGRGLGLRWRRGKGRLYCFEVDRFKRDDCG